MSVRARCLEDHSIGLSTMPKKRLQDMYSAPQLSRKAQVTEQEAKGDMEHVHNLSRHLS